MKKFEEARVNGGSNYDSLKESTIDIAEMSADRVRPRQSVGDALSLLFSCWLMARKSARMPILLPKTSVRTEEVGNWRFRLPSAVHLIRLYTKIDRSLGEADAMERRAETLIPPLGSPQPLAQVHLWPELFIGLLASR